MIIGFSHSLLSLGVVVMLQTTTDSLMDVSGSLSFFISLARLQCYVSFRRANFLTSPGESSDSLTQAYDHNYYIVLRRRSRKQRRILSV
jgi:hypothetical protein